MDIRKWFTAPKPNSSLKSDAKHQVAKKTSPRKDANKSKKRRIISSDSDEEPLPVQKKQSKKRSVDDDNDVINIEPVQDIEIQRKGKSPQEKKQIKHVSSVKAEKKVVSVDDFFGCTFVSRKEKQVPQKLEVSVLEKNHDDEDFCKTLGKLDESYDKNQVVEKKTERNGMRDDNQEKKTQKKQEVNGKKKTLKKKTKSESNVKLDFIPNPVKKTTTVVIDKTPLKSVSTKRKNGNSNYFSYLEREGPKALGSKEIPEGEENCLENMSFVVTGILESMERDEAKALIEKYGGKVMSTFSKKTNYIVIGRDAGCSKLEKAKKFGTTQLDEDGLLELIRTMPGKGVGNKKPKLKKEAATKSKQQSHSSVENTSDLELLFDAEDGDSFSDIKSPPVDPVNINVLDFTKNSVGTDLDIKSPPKDEVNANEEILAKESGTCIKTSSENHDENADVTTPSKRTKYHSESVPQQNSKSKNPVKNRSENSSMWVDKYKPTSLKQLIGQQGEKCNAKKLLHWLLNWSKNRKLNKKPNPGRRLNTNDDGSGFKAALLSGPPGVGKTTTSQLVCKEVGFDFFELNASDTRSKKSLQHVVSQLLGNQTLADCFKAGSSGNKVSQNHVIIMDEVDGMAGNEDRGGVQELISYIKASRIPVICICNDRNHPKIRSLANYCFDLRFQRPRVEQIKAAMLSVAFKEGIKISPNALQDVILSSNQDIRQVLHNLSVWSANECNLTAEQIKLDIGRGTKHIKLGPFDVLREVFAIGNNPNATIIDKSDLFFHDYSIAPLFVQENYVHVLPTATDGNTIKHLCLLSETSNSICIGDLIDRQIRAQNNWNLLPTQSIFASVVPGELMKGHLRQMINFPAWLGKNSNRNHMHRILQELHMHMRMRVSGNKTDVALEYLPLLKRALTKPLIEKETEGVADVLKTMKEYYLLREDFDSIVDLSLWPQQIDPRTKIITKVKSAFTRTYNKECGPNPYAASKGKKKKKSDKESETDLLEDDDEILSEEDDSLESDAMVKVKKVTKKSTDSGDPKPKASGSKQTKKPKSKK